MKTHRRLLSLSITIILMSILLNGCSLPHQAILSITSPHDNDTFPANANLSIHIRVFRDGHSNFEDGSWEGYEWLLYDGYGTIGNGQGMVSQGEFDFPIISAPEGPHYLQVRARAFRADPDYAEVPNNPYRLYSEWLLSNEVCFYVGPNPPQDFCQIRTIAQPLILASSTPTATLTATVTGTATSIPPTLTPVPPIPTRKNPNQHGGNGCSQYTDQTSCFLAACSWNDKNHTCIVIP